MSQDTGSLRQHGGGNIADYMIEQWKAWAA